MSATTTTAAAATTTAAATTAAATTAVATATTVAAVTGTSLFVLCRIDANCSAVQRLIVHLGASTLSGLFAAERHEAETTAPPGFTIGNHLRFRHLSVRREC
jgi:hypothetical protein